MCRGELQAACPRLPSTGPSPLRLTGLGCVGRAPGTAFRDHWQPARSHGTPVGHVTGRDTWRATRPGEQCSPSCTRLTHLQRHYCEGSTDTPTKLAITGISQTKDAELGHKHRPQPLDSKGKHLLARHSLSHNPLPWATCMGCAAPSRGHSCPPECSLQATSPALTQSLLAVQLLRKPQLPA